MTDGPKDQVDRDIQDHQFGMAAAQDQELAEDLENEGAAPDELRAFKNVPGEASGINSKLSA